MEQSGGAAMSGGAGGKSMTGGTAAGGAGGTATTGGTVAEGGAGGTAMAGGTGGIPFSVGLIGHWKFDEGAGSVVPDASGNNNDGTIVEGQLADASSHPSPVWATGKFGGAITIDGIDDWVRVPDSDSIDSTGINKQVSISAWVKLAKYNQLKKQNVFAQRHEAGTRIEHFFMGLSDGKPAVGIQFSFYLGQNLFPLNQWVHMAMTYDGIEQCGYINGVVFGCQDVGWPLAGDETPFTMGAGINETDAIEQINGLIDEVRLYNVALTSPDVVELSQQTLP
jgi:Concanavalin A-like lectin/glucanases superfamily